MKYDFDSVTDRRGTDSMKWEVKENELPMWVADMDFKAAPEIIDALRKRIDHGVFGYAGIPDAWYEAYGKWWDKRHGLKMKRENLIFSTGVIPSISTIIKELTNPGENVLIQSPVYHVFYNIIRNNGRNVFENPLQFRDGVYSMDFADLETKMSDPKTKLMILCNPHNPIAKIWDRESLEKVGELAEKYGVTVISDEIHCDITKPGRDYLPFAAISEVCREISITCIAPTKTFNLAGLQTSAVYVSASSMKYKLLKALMRDDAADPNSFSTAAAIAAFENGEAWLDELREYLFDNRKMVEDFLASELPSVKAVQGDATYLVWLDLMELHDTGKNVAVKLREKTGLYVSDGGEFGTGGEHFLRMNIACPKSICTDGLNRLKKGIMS